MSVSTPEMLQFAAFIGEQEGFDPFAVDVPASPAEAEWRVWWEELPALEAGHGAAIRRAAQERQRIPNPSRHVWLDPPEFEHWSDLPALQELCRRHWPAFKDGWDREKPLLAEQERRQTEALGLQRMVRDALRQAGKRGADFTLVVTFVRWPPGYQRPVDANHLVLGVSYLEPAHLADLRGLLSARIAALV